MNKSLLPGLLFCLASNAWAAEQTVATLEDPAGDDNGNGALVYPQRAGFAAGDLDLLSLRITRGEDEYRFEATFRNPIRDPAKVAGDVGPEPLSYFARRGFYAFNVDVYIDQDRIGGSGNTYTLPGRGASIDAAHAWERAVVLTPRPELMRKQLIDAIADSEGARDTTEVARRIDASIAFPTEVQVRGRTVAFSVPAAFLASSGSDTDWSITALVTGAKTTTEASLDILDSSGTALQRLTLGAMQPKPGHPRDTFGYTGETAAGPIVDLLAPPPLKQSELLSGSARLVGVSGGSASAVAKPGSAKPVTSITTAPAVAPAARSAEPATPARGDIAERLRRLNELKAQGLVSDDEYRQLREKILSEL